jgi:hypothetical protein
VDVVVVSFTDNEYFDDILDQRVNDAVFSSVYPALAVPGAFERFTVMRLWIVQQVEDCRAKLPVLFNIEHRNTATVQHCNAGEPQDMAGDVASRPRSAAAALRIATSVVSQPMQLSVTDWP